MNRKSAFAVACAVSATAALGVVASPAGATTFTDFVGLDKLLMPTTDPLIFESNGMDFLVDDKLFSNFSVIIGCTPDPDCDSAIQGPLDPGSITVEEWFVDNNPGIRFSDAFFALEGASIDFLINYTVEALDPNQLISDVHLGFNGAATESGFADVVETVRDMNNNILGQLKVNTEENLTDWFFLDTPRQKLNITKDILLIGGNEPTATISEIDQTFSQTPVPEPGTVTGLLAIGSLSVGAMLKRHFGKKA
jgi:hypothetical protein